MGKLVRRLERKRKTRLRKTPFTDEWSAAKRKKKISGLTQSRYSTKVRADKSLRHLRKTRPGWEHRKVKVNKGWKVISVRR